MKVALVVSSPMTMRAFLQDQVKALAARYEVTVVANYRDAGELGSLPDRVRIRRIGIRRQVAPGSDLKALIALWRLFRREGFDVVHSVTPKAGLLSMLAARLAWVPHRLHTFTGQVWATRSGPMRRFYRFLDKLIFRFSSRCFVDSRSQREFLLREGVVDEMRSVVLGEGSISGVDIERFVPDSAARCSTRAALAIHPDAFVCLFLGRMNRDKGILDLAAAFAALQPSDPASVLLLVGPDEGGIRDSVRAFFKGRLAQLRFVEFTDRPQDFMNAADLFCLPSYREGFGSVVIEAGAVGIPAVGSRIYGVSDAIVDGVTGVLHQVRDVEDLRDKISAMRSDPVMRKAMGQAARQRAQAHFAQPILTDALLHAYAEMLGTR
jgi:glycosyltransferase involved in cell wall biosynthesis